MNDPKKVIGDLVDLVELWQNGLFKNIGITWEKDPPAMIQAREYLEQFKGEKE